MATFEARPYLIKAAIFRKGHDKLSVLVIPATIRRMLPSAHADAMADADAFEPDEHLRNKVQALPIPSLAS